MSNVDQLFNQLSPKKISEIIFKAVKNAATVLKSKTISNLHKPSLSKGVKIRPNKTLNEAKVHIMGDYRLKWFEKGTVERYTKGHRVAGKQNRHLIRSGKGGYRGRMSAKYFFQKARNDEESLYKAMFTSVTESLNKIG